MVGFEKTIDTSSLPFAKLIAQGSSFSDIPDRLRHKIGFNLVETNLLIESSLSYSATLPEIAGKRVTLSYTPATPADAQLMSDAAGILGFPLYLVEVIPELKIEGQTVATGQAVGMGADQSFEMTFQNPNSFDDKVANIVQAGQYYAIGLDVNTVSFQYLKDRADRWQPDLATERDDRLGELLFLLSMFYFANTEFLAKEAAKASDIVTLRHPSESIVGLRLNANFLFNIPVSVSSVGLNIDVDRDLVSAVSKSNNNDTRFWFVIRNGLQASAQEHLLFESIMGLEAISTVKFIDLANNPLQPVPIYLLDSANPLRVDELQIALQDKQDIKNFTNAGKMVIVPKSEIQHFDYTGIGYHVVDLETGAGVFRISGGFKGGDTVGENVQALVDLANELIGRTARAVAVGYKDAINSILAGRPEIGGLSDLQFREFTERMLYWGGFAKKIKLDIVKVIVAQQILYHTILMLISIPEQT